MLQIDLSAYSKNGLLTDIGYAFERYTVELLNKNGYKAYKTQSVGDFGGDVIAEKDNVKYAIQCKYSTKDIGVKALQEAIAGREYYSCDKAVVITNCDFTKQAQDFAQKTNVLLWNENQLSKFIKNAEIPEYVEYMEKPDDDTEYDFSSNFTEADYKVQDVIERLQSYEKDIKLIYTVCLTCPDKVSAYSGYTDYKSLVVQPEEWHYDEYNNYVPNSKSNYISDINLIENWCKLHLQDFYTDLCELDKCLGVEDCQSNYKEWYDELNKMYEIIYAKCKAIIKNRQQQYQKLRSIETVQDIIKQEEYEQQTKYQVQPNETLQNTVKHENNGQQSSNGNITQTKVKTDWKSNVVIETLINIAVYIFAFIMAKVLKTVNIDIMFWVATVSFVLGGLVWFGLFIRHIGSDIPKIQRKKEIRYSFACLVFGLTYIYSGCFQ